MFNIMIEVSTSAEADLDATVLPLFYFYAPGLHKDFR